VFVIFNDESNIRPMARRPAKSQMSNATFSSPWNFVSLDIKEILTHHELSDLGHHIYALFVLRLGKISLNVFTWFF